MIRPAALPDRFAVLRLGKAFLAASGLDLPFDAAWAERTVKSYIEAPDRLCLVMEADGAVQGVLLAHAANHPFGPFKVAAELLWWVAPPFRGRSSLPMLDAYEAWAREQGCRFMNMASLGDERVARIYERRGFGAIEQHFLKAL